jgi:hypothetical protein
MSAAGREIAGQESHDSGRRPAFSFIITGFQSLIVTGWPSVLRKRRDGGRPAASNTTAAEGRNAENVLVLHDPAVAQGYEHGRRRLWGGVAGY